jgi:5-methylcytosine-specific restriction endonuclease McrA
MHKDSKGKLVCILGAQMEVDISDLPSRSVQKVLAKCDNPECGKERWVEYNKYTDLCHKCALQTESYKINNGNANRGKKRTPEQIERLKRPNYASRGENNASWDVNKTDEERKIQNEKTRNYVDYYVWRLAIFRKDGYQCQRCGYIGKKINAHHIENYFSNKELRTDINNGIVLCIQCHKLFHYTYGRKNNNGYQIDEFLKDRELIGFVKRQYSNNLSRQGSKNINHTNDSSRFVGVSKNKNRKKWDGGIYCNGIKYDLGQFEFEVEAAMAYNEAALELHGWKANLNNITQEEIDILWKM